MPTYHNQKLFIRLEIDARLMRGEASLDEGAVDDLTKRAKNGVRDGVRVQSVRAVATTGRVEPVRL